MRATNDLGAANYAQTHEYGEAQNAFGNVSSSGRSRGTPLLSTLPLRTRTAQGRPRTPGVVARVLGKTS